MSPRGTLSKTHHFSQNDHHHPEPGERYGERYDIAPLACVASWSFQYKPSFSPHATSLDFCQRAFLGWLSRAASFADAAYFEASGLMNEHLSCLYDFEDNEDHSSVGLSFRACTSSCEVTITLFSPTSFVPFRGIFMNCAQECWI